MKLEKTASGLHFFIGIGAVAGGIGALVDIRGGAMGISTEMLQHSPFKTFLVPGLFLLLVLGLGNCLAGYVTLKHANYAPYLNLCFGGILVLWIVIQCWMLQVIAAPHVLYFVLGVIQGLLGLVICLRSDCFPFPWIVSKTGIRV